MNRLYTNWRGQWNGCLGGLVLLALTLSPLCAQTNTESATTNSAAPKMPPPAPRRPSIVLILADNIGYGDLGCYGQTKIKTPHLDQLAKEGVRFTSFYAASPEGGQARAALFTGLNPEHSGAGFNQVMAPDALTLATYLKRLGYYTGLLGEWGLGDIGSLTPSSKGFDQFVGFLTQNHAREYYSDRVWRYAPEHTNVEFLETIVPNSNGEHGKYLPDLMTAAALQFIRIQKPDTFNKHQPFFLCVSYPIPHAGPISDDAPYANEPWPQPEKDRAAMITRMDTGVGRIMDQLEKFGIATNTIVVFTSVNGPQKEDGMDPQFFNSNGPFRGLAGSVYEGGIRVPLIVRWPAKVPADRASDLVCEGSDLFPTIAEMALSEPPKKLDGISIIPTLLGNTQTNRHEILNWQSNEKEPQQAARSGDWKLVHIGTNAPALYDLKTDPGEKHDVAAKNRGIAEKIKKVLKH